MNRRCPYCDNPNFDAEPNRCILPRDNVAPRRPVDPYDLTKFIHFFRCLCCGFEEETERLPEGYQR